MNQNASLNITVGAIKFTQNKYSTGAHLENVLPSLFVPALYNTGSSLAPAILRAPLLTDRKLRLVRHTGQRKGYDGAAKASAESYDSVFAGYIANNTPFPVRTTIQADTEAAFGIDDDDIANPDFAYIVGKRPSECIHEGEFRTGGGGRQTPRTGLRYDFFNPAQLQQVMTTLMCYQIISARSTAARIKHMIEAKKTQEQKQRQHLTATSVDYIYRKDIVLASNDLRETASLQNHFGALVKNRASNMQVNVTKNINGRTVTVTAYQAAAADAGFLPMWDGQQVTLDGLIKDMERSAWYQALHDNGHRCAVYGWEIRAYLLCKGELSMSRIRDLINKYKTFAAPSY
jgi:hypothetical protein